LLSHYFKRIKQSHSREIGEGNVTDAQMAVIREQLKNIPAEEFNHDLSLAPLWVRKQLTVQ